MPEDVIAQTEVGNKYTDWPIGLGYYGDIPLYQEPQIPPTVEELTGIEITMKNQIGKMLKERRDKGDLTPLVVVDFGGGAGISMLKIAQALTAEGVSPTSVDFFVTNLEGGEENILTSLENQTQTSKRSRFALELLRDNQLKHNIQYVAGGASELIEALNGRQVSILHERNVFRHGYTNDADLEKLGSLMAEDGIMFLDPQGPEMKSTDTEEVINARRERHTKGLAKLTEMGLKKVELSKKEMNYLVYSKGEQPLLS